MYKVCVGEGGMPPEYFMHTCTFWEAVIFVDGVRCRQRQGWEQARYVAYYAAAPHCKNFKFESMGQFPWEKEKEEPVDEETVRRELAELRASALARDAMYIQEMKQQK